MTWFGTQLERAGRSPLLVVASVLILGLSGCSGADAEDVVRAEASGLSIAELNECMPLLDDPAQDGFFTEGVLAVDHWSRRAESSRAHSWMISGVTHTWVSGSFSEATESSQDGIVSRSVRIEMTDLEGHWDPDELASEERISVVVQEGYLERARAVVAAGGSVLVPLGERQLTSPHHVAFGTPEDWDTLNQSGDGDYPVLVPMIAFLPDGQVTPIGGGCTEDSNASFLDAAYREREVPAARELTHAEYIRAVIEQDTEVVAELTAPEQFEPPPKPLEWADRSPLERPLDLAPPDILAGFGRAHVQVVLTGNEWFSPAGGGWVCSYTVMGRGSCYAVVMDAEGGLTVGIDVLYDRLEGVTIDLYEGREEINSPPDLTVLRDSFAEIHIPAVKLTGGVIVEGGPSVADGLRVR